MQDAKFYCIVFNVTIVIFRFDIDGAPHVLKFEDALQTILVNGCPVNMQFGGRCISIIVNKKMHRVRLSELPAGILPGEVTITNMSTRKKHTGFLEPSPVLQLNSFPYRSGLYRATLKIRLATLL